MINTGELKASDLIKKLEKMIKQHGDRYVFSGGSDYPEAVSGVWIEERGNGYVPAGCFKIR
jgi:hypothetical protein